MVSGDKVIDSFSWKRNQMIEKFEKQRDKEADVRDQYGVRAIDTRLTIDALVPEDAKASCRSFDHVRNIAVTASNTWSISSCRSFDHVIDTAVTAVSSC